MKIAVFFSVMACASLLTASLKSEEKEVPQTSPEKFSTTSKILPTSQQLALIAREKAAAALLDEAYFKKETAKLASEKIATTSLVPQTETSPQVLTSTVSFTVISPRPSILLIGSEKVPFEKLTQHLVPDGYGVGLISGDGQVSDGKFSSFIGNPWGGFSALKDYQVGDLIGVCDGVNHFSYYTVSDRFTETKKDFYILDDVYSSGENIVLHLENTDDTVETFVASAN